MKRTETNGHDKPADRQKVAHRSGRDTGDTPRRSTSLRTLDDLDGRTRAAKLAQRLVAGLEADLGGDLTTGQREIVKRVALSGAIVEDLETRWLEGERIDLADYVRVANAQRRLCVTLGLDRVPRDVTGQAIELLRASQ